MGIIWKLFEKCGDSAAAALFWILIIFAIAGALIWMFNNGVDYLLKEEPGIKKLTSKKSSEESEE
jgi:hypothetical protein